MQLGGGIRDLDTIERYLDDGISYIIIGTAAVKTPGFLHDACYAFPGHVMVALDAKDGKVAVDGWSKMTGHDVIDLAKRFQEYGVEAIIYTDIGRDGMLTGVNIEATVELARASVGSGDRQRRHYQSGRRQGAVRRRSRKASSAPSPGAQSTRARSTSRKRRSSPTSSRRQSRSSLTESPRTACALGPDIPLAAGIDAAARILIILA